ncbi:MAG: hypothetical protein E7258_05310 [Lachnospiraceae bacterium]|nr:hypothetical protein [Lachnospiraceae bacterium]
MSNKKLIGIEKRSWNSKEDGKEKSATVLHMVEDIGCSPENVVGQRVILENLWGISDVEKEVNIQGKLEIGCHISIYYEGEGNFKKLALIVCSK